MKRTPQQISQAIKASRHWINEADAYLDEQAIGDAIWALSEAKDCEPRRIERMELLRRIQHLEALNQDLDWPEAAGTINSYC